VTPLCSLRRAFADPKLLGTTLRGDSWLAWRVLLIAAMGEPLRDDERALFQQLTGREHEPRQRVQEFVAVVGRRGGKSRALATLAIYLAALCEHRLAPGERGLVLVLAQNQRAARIILDYAEAAFDATPLLRKLVAGRSDNVIELNTGVALEVRWQSFRAVRGFTYLAAMCDEVAYWWSEDSYANPDVETLAAIRPGLLTTQGQLVLASSPYARKGVLWDAYRRHYGADGDPAVLVVKGTTRELNPTVPQAWIDAELARDPVRNRAEYFAEFRADIETFINRDVVEACVGDFFELSPAPDIRYRAFVDPAGGSGGDSFSLAVAHKDGDNVVVDCVRERRPPFSPSDVVTEFAQLLREYRVTRVTGDKWAGGFPPEAFRTAGISYEPAPKPKSDIYVELLPLLNSGRLVLPKNDRLVQQLVALERRTARGSGRDSIDHPPGANDDVANAVAGAALLARKPGYDSSFDWVAGPDVTDPETERALAAEYRRRAVFNYVSTGGFTKPPWAY
jgi:hypothetical protein